MWGGASRTRGRGGQFFWENILKIFLKYFKNIFEI
jgi:hypothetical protein